MKTLKCACCGYQMLTWTEARRSYGRLIGSGLTQDEAKGLSPRCYRCTTSVLKHQPDQASPAVGQCSQSSQ